jgi:hypothetical protein
MSYSSKPIWIPIDKQAEEIATTASGTMTAVQSAGVNIPRGICVGYHIRVSAANGALGALPVDLYDAQTGGDLLYRTTVDLTAETEDVAQLDKPIPFFETPYFQIGNVGATGGPLTFTVRYMFKALA